MTRSIWTEKRRLQQRIRRIKNREQHNRWARGNNERLKLEVFDHYGCKCAQCGEDNVVFLQLDHINNDGRDHRKLIGMPKSGHSIVLYRWAKKNNYPPIFQILCANCNFIKSIEVIRAKPKSEIYGTIWRRENLVKLKHQVFSYYTQGDIKCQCCGEDRYDALQLDHINNDGANHRKLLPTTTKLYKWIIDNGYPEGYQVLCANCNSVKGTLGQCVHKHSLEFILPK